VWKSVSLMTGKVDTNVPVVFEDVHFHRATNIPKEGLYDTVHCSYSVCIIYIVHAYIPYSSSIFVALSCLCMAVKHL
jgi:hypothetical protein